MGAVNIRKIISIIILSLLCFSSLSTAVSFTNLLIKPSIKTNLNQNYTHTVFSGTATSQNCGSCHLWSKSIYNEYILGNYDFEYVSMVIFDENGHILNNEAFNWSNNYYIISYPSTVFDGDFKRITGNHIEQLPDILNACGNRTVANITANVTLTWLENASINVNFTIQNNEDTQYYGHAEAFITEYISRYNTSEGEPFHFGFLDFAINENISINASEIYSRDILWNGSEHYNEHGNNYSDIRQNNVVVTLVVYNNTNGYTDETVSFIFPNNPPNQPNDPNPTDGETGVNLNPELTWNCSDPDGDSLRYDVYFGTDSSPPLVETNLTAASYKPETLLLETTYYWKIVAKDPREAVNESPIWNFTSRINVKPNPPFTPNGSNKGEEGQELIYNVTGTDPEGDDLFYWFDWGDGTNSGWFGPFPSGVEASNNHNWTENGEYKIKARAKDIFGAESEWSEPLNLTIIEPLIQIINLSGGSFRVKAVIKNTGELEATNITWNINLISGFIFRGEKTSGKIDKILPGEEITIKSKIILGLGRTDITINAKKPGGGLDIKYSNAYIFTFFIKIKNTNA